MAESAKILFLIGREICRREGLLGWFSFLFSKVRPRVVYLGSGDDSWEERGVILFKFSSSLVIALVMEGGKIRYRFFSGGVVGDLSLRIFLWKGQWWSFL